MAGVSIPTGTQLPSHLRISCTNRTVQKSLGRLARSSLIALALSWIETDSPLSAPRLLRYHLRARGVEADSDDEEEYEHEFDDEAYAPARSLADLQGIYEVMKEQKGSKSEVLGRITECDWKDGISLYQLAMVDFQHLADSPLAMKWSAYQIAPLQLPADDEDAEDPSQVDDESLILPTFHPSAFLRNLQRQVLPDMKVHYCFDRHSTLSVVLLRILVLDSPYSTSLALQDDRGQTANFDASRTVYLGFPDSAPYVYVSKAQTSVAFQAGDAKTLQHLIIEGVPKALSQARTRFMLRPTDLSSKNLAEMLDRKGPNRTNRAAGGWSFYSDKSQHKTPLVSMLPTPSPSDSSAQSSGRTAPAMGKRASSPASVREARTTKRLRRVAKARFGGSSTIHDGKGVERVDVAILDPLPVGSATPNSDEQADRDVSQYGGERRQSRLVRGKTGRRSDMGDVLDRVRDALQVQEDGQDLYGPTMKLTFHGPHVFAGIRQLIEHGIIDGERMPGWMTGQEGVTVGVVRHGRIQGSKS